MRGKSGEERRYARKFRASWRRTNAEKKEVFDRRKETANKQKSKKRFTAMTKICVEDREGIKTKENNNGVIVAKSYSNSMMQTG